jgi:hypothetical protein
MNIIIKKGINMNYINEFTYIMSFFKIKPLVVLIMCLFFSVPHFIAAQTSVFNIGLGSSLSFEFANNTTNMVYPAPSINSTYYVKNKNYYFDAPIDLYVTIDLLYLEASMGFWFGGRSIGTDWEETRRNSSGGTHFDYNSTKDGGYIGGWTWSVFLKMPAFVNKMWFPMIGIESRVLDWISPEKILFQIHLLIIPKHGVIFGLNSALDLIDPEYLPEKGFLV